MKRLCDYVIESLVDSGVKDVFCITGRGSLFLNDALAKNKDINVIFNHHEQSSSFAAAAYSQYKNDLAACVVSTGCASTNTLTGLLCAWQDGLPVIFISGQNILNETTYYTGLNLRTYGQQEANIIEIVKPLTKHAVTITDPKDIVYEFEKAKYLANNGRKGPVWIDIPLDLQSSIIDPSILKKYIPNKTNSINKSLNKVLDELIIDIENSKRPLFVIGSGVLLSNSTYEFNKLINKLKIPFVYTHSAVDIDSENENLKIGSIGSMGCSRSGNFSLQNADLIIVLGSRLSTLVTGSDYCNFGRSAKKYVVDIDPREHSKNTVKIDKLITSDVKLFLNNLNKKDINKGSWKSWTKQCISWKSTFPICENFFRARGPVDLYEVSESLSKLLSKDSVLITDSGYIEVILPTNINFPKGSRSIHPISQGSMGFAIPAAIGAYYASGGSKEIIVFVGDGSIMMNLQELQTIRYYNMPIKIFVINNDDYAIIRRRQKELFRKRTIGTDSSNGVKSTPIKAYAKCFEFEYKKIKNIKEFDNNFPKILKIDGPVITEVMGRLDQEYIEVATTRSSSGKFVRPPLEDQYPFIDREKFKNEMIVKPLIEL